MGNLRAEQGASSVKEPCASTFKVAGGKRVCSKRFNSPKVQALLAFMDQEERKSLFRRKPLKKLTKKTVTDPKRLEAELDTIRKRGFALSRGEAVPGGAVGVAAPIRDSRGTVTAALAVTLPATLVPSVSFPRIIRATVSMGFRISEALGYKNSSSK